MSTSRVNKPEMIILNTEDDTSIAITPTWSPTPPHPRSAQCVSFVIENDDRDSAEGFQTLSFGLTRKELDLLQSVLREI